MLFTELVTTVLQEIPETAEQGTTETANGILGFDIQAWFAGNHPEVMLEETNKAIERAAKEKEDAAKREEEARKEKEAAAAREEEMRKKITDLEAAVAAFREKAGWKPPEESKEKEEGKEEGAGKEEEKKQA